MLRVSTDDALAGPEIRTRTGTLPTDIPLNNSFPQQKRSAVVPKSDGQTITTSRYPCNMYRTGAARKPARKPPPPPEPSPFSNSEKLYTHAGVGQLAKKTLQFRQSRHRLRTCPTATTHTHTRRPPLLDTHVLYGILALRIHPSIHSFPTKKCGQACDLFMSLLVMAPLF
jgi:hypothetical protein